MGTGKIGYENPEGRLLESVASYEGGSKSDIALIAVIFLGSFSHPLLQVGTVIAYARNASKTIILLIDSDKCVEQ